MRAMRKVAAVRLVGAGGPEVLEIGSIEVPDPGPEEVRVAVVASGLNRADLLQRRGLYPAPPSVAPDVPGLEYAGTVTAVGARVTAFGPNDRVMGIVGGGGMAAEVVVHERTVLPVPDTFTDVEAAAVPEVFLTAYDAVCLQAGLTTSETLLVHAAASGVGTAAVQLARLFGARVLGTSRTAEKLEGLDALGLSFGIVPDEGRFADQVNTVTEGRGADVILDLVGGAYLAEDLGAVAMKGRIMLVGLVGGGEGTLPLRRLLARRARITGTVLRARPLEEKAALTQSFRRAILPHLAAGRLRTVIDRTFPADQIREAHAHMEANANVGKIVVTW